MITDARRRRVAGAALSLALWSCLPGDSLDRSLPASRAEQDKVAETLPEPQRNHFQIYLTEIEPAARGARLPTVREAIAAGRRRAEDQVREISGMRAMLQNSTGSAGTNGRPPPSK